jgi:hypothetical protein
VSEGEDVLAELRQDAVVVDEVTGGKRRLNQLLLRVDESFQNSALRNASANVQLIVERARNDSQRALLVRIPEAELDRALEILKLTDGVLIARKHSVREAAWTPNDPRWGGQVELGLGSLRLTQAWEVTRGVPSVRVAVLDTGVTPIPELYGRLAPGYDAFFDNSSDTTDLAIGTGHGTRVASVLGSVANNGTMIAGVAPNVTIVPVRACNEILECDDLLLEDALRWIGDHGNIDVVNMSIGGPGVDAGVASYLQELAFDEVILVASSGNAIGGASSDEVYFPASDTNVIAVGGTTASGARHPESRWGPEIDVAAPYDAWTVNKFGYEEMIGGTSYSAPMISGVAALWKSSAVVFDTTADFRGALAAYGAHEWNQYTGYGPPDAYRVVWKAACIRFDVAPGAQNFRIDLADAQATAHRVGAVLGLTLYDDRFDLQPATDGYFGQRDGDIDPGDLQKVMGRVWLSCPQ